MTVSYLLVAATELAKKVFFRLMAGKNCLYFTPREPSLLPMLACSDGKVQVADEAAGDEHRHLHLPASDVLYGENWPHSNLSI